MVKLTKAQVAVGIGTTNGGYLLLSDKSRRVWKKRGPFLKGESVNRLTYSHKGKKLYAATLTDGVFVSGDFGKTWKPINRGLHVRKVWTVAVDPKTPSTLYAGTHYGHLFRSKSGGESWEEVTGLHTAPKRNDWGIDWGFGTVGLCIHTVRIDSTNADRIYIVSSGGGPYRTDDAGATWSLLNKGVVESCPVGAKHDSPEIPREQNTGNLEQHLRDVHRCTHQLLVSAQNHDLLYQQNHCGVYRSQDAGNQWEDISPSDSLRHGFSMSLVENGGRTIYTIPAFQGACKKHNSCVVGGLAVYRNRNGEGWERLEAGLPKNAHTCVLRHAMAADHLSPSGVYFGTTTGEIFGTKDGGDSWSLMVRGIGRVQGISSLFQ